MEEGPIRRIPTQETIRAMSVRTAGCITRSSKRLAQLKAQARRGHTVWSRLVEREGRE